MIAQDTTKNKTNRRTLPLVATFREKLLKLKEGQEYNRKLCGRSYNRDYLEYIYVNEIGERIKPGYITTQFPIFLEHHGFRRIRFHDLRHTYVKTATTHFLRNFKEFFCIVSIAVNP